MSPDFSDPAVDLTNPDDPNRDAYDDLLAAVLASTGQLSLLIAVADDPQLRSDLIRQYETELAGDYRLYRVRLARGEPSMKAAILQALADDSPQLDEKALITVTGIESLSFLKLGNEKSEQDLFFGYLQWTREALRAIRYPIVIWVTYQVLAHLSRKSPDFWSWRRGVFRFVTRTRAAIPAGRLRGIDQSILGLDRLDEETLLPLADLQALIQHTEQQNPKDPLLASLYRQMGRVYQQRLEDGEAQDYRVEEALALEYLQKAVDLLSEAGESLDLAESLNNLAGLYREQGRYEEAEPLYLQALQMWKTLLGETHPGVALSLNNLAALYNSQGRYEEAEPLYLQALQMRKTLLGETHPDVATSLNNLALLYDHQGRYEEAEPLYLQALQMWKTLLGETHPNVATSFNNLGAFYVKQGNFEAAIPLLQQALEICERVLGDAHPRTQITREWLTKAERGLAEVSGAEE